MSNKPRFTLVKPRLSLSKFWPGLSHSDILVCVNAYFPFGCRTPSLIICKGILIGFEDDEF